MRDIYGDFEMHLTVSAVDGAHDRLRSWAERHGLKYTRIVLDRGQTPDQPMLTVRGRGTLDEQRDSARSWTQRLHDAGFPVVRVKIEASPFNAHVPENSAQAAALPPSCYFEHHVKLVLAGEDDTARVREVSERHAAHLSRNARRALVDGRVERFVTQRCRGVGRTEARRRLDDLLAAIAAEGFATVEVEEEFVVVDDNPHLDLGWIDERPVQR
jgi:hypothetical protein